MRRYLPYDRVTALSNAETADNLDPAQHFEAAHDNAFPGDMPEYSKSFRTDASREAAGPALKFMQGKHVAILGSSLDREGVRHFCEVHKGSQRRDHRHRFTSCHWPTNNFTLSLWHSYGVHQTSWWGGADKGENGKILEDRLDRVFIPEAHSIGHPTLLIFSSGLWGRRIHNPTPDS